MSRSIDSRSEGRVFSWLAKLSDNSFLPAGRIVNLTAPRAPAGAASIEPRFSKRLKTGRELPTEIPALAMSSYGVAKPELTRVRMKYSRLESMAETWYRGRIGDRYVF